MPIEVKVPELGESVKQATLLKWHKNEGQAIRADEPVCELETDKANVYIPAPGAGVFHPLKNEGEQVNVGEVIAQIDAAASAAAPAKPAKPEVPKSQPQTTQPPQSQQPEAQTKKQPQASAPTVVPMPPPVPVPSQIHSAAQPAPGPTMEKKKDVATVAASIAPSQALPRRPLKRSSRSWPRAAMRRRTPRRPATR